MKRILFVLFLCFPPAARSEKIEWEDQATNVVVGTVKKVDVHRSVSFDLLASYFARHYRAAIEVEAVVSGHGVQPGQTIYVCYWREDWVPRTLVAILGVVWVARIRIKRHVHFRPVRWTLLIVLYTVALPPALWTLPMPKMWGHHHFPLEGDKAKVYLKARPSGEYDALYPEWFGRGKPHTFHRPPATKTVE